MRALAALGVTPTAVTLTALAGSAAGAVLIARGSLLAGGIVVLLFGALDMFDGALARATGRATDFGALLDSTLDRVSEALVLLGVLVYALDRGHDEQAVLAFVALTGSLLVSYVRARAEGLGLALKSGLFTRPERVVLLSAGLIVGWLRLALWILAVLTSLTALQRLWVAGAELRRRDHELRPREHEQGEAPS